MTGSHRPGEAVILAGGLGTRLRGVVDDVPKPMAPIAGRPFLEWLLDAAFEQGIRRAILSVGYRSDAIRNHFGDRYGGIELAYAVEEEPLGTGGALRRALGEVVGTAAYVLNGDTYQDLDYGTLAAARAQVPDTSLAIALRFVPEASRFGRAVVEDGRLLAFRSGGSEGPGLINAGVYLASKGLFEGCRLPDPFSFERDFLEPRIDRLSPAVYVAEGRFIDIGVPASFREAQTLIPRLAAGSRPDAGISAGRS
jgi:D-glycero-alpha-D-manno-heptose 1-phosphate guanylyltransferase